MKTFLNLIFNRGVLAVLGLTAVAVLIWFVGPLFALADYRPLESEVVRWVVIGIVIAVYIAKLVFRLVKAKWANSKLIDGLLKQSPAPTAPDDTAAAQEIATLRKRFEEGLTVLKQAGLGDSSKKSARGFFAALTPRRYLYQLPWYIFIGAPGSGKTTALIHSGLNFPLAGRLGNEVRGVGGTRNCDWFFTDDAVLIDTAGRYTTQETDREVDSAAWGGFLQLLKKFRPRRPINGAIVTVSVPDLLGQSAPQREAHAAALRRRLIELNEQTSIRFPVYVMVTKLDLLAGFTEFFSTFGKEERAQVWGFSFPLAKEETGSALGTIAEQLVTLEKRLNDRLIDRLEEERDPQKRALVYGLPQQFSQIRELLNEFVLSVFAPSRFEQQPLLRGVYFTSGTQEGSPIDRVIGGLARSLGLERKLLPSQKASGKSFFLTRLLKEVIFPEAGLAGTDRRPEQRRVLFQGAALAVAVLVTVGLVAAWTISYFQNKAYVARVTGRLQTVAKEVESLRPAGNVANLLPVLHSVRELASASRVLGESPPLSMGFGLYQGDKLGAAANNAYRRLLQDVFLPRVALRIEELLRVRDNPELLYESLKAYIMLHELEHLDVSQLRAFITTDWDASLPREVTTEQRKELESHLSTLLERGGLSSPLPVNQPLIASVRDSVARTPIAQRIYHRLNRQGVGADIPEFTIAKAGGPAAPLVFHRASGQPLTKGIPGLFTHDGYHKAFLKESERVTGQLAAEEAWVMGSRARPKLLEGSAKDQVFGEVRRLYLQDYARTWEAFVNDIKLVRATNLQQSIQLARILSSPDSPLPVLMRTIVKEVTLVQVDESEKGLAEKATDKLKDKRDDLLKIFGRPGEPPPSAGTLARPEAIVDERFENLRKLVRSPAPGQLAPIDQATVLFNDLYTMFLAQEEANKRGTTPPASDVPIKVKADASRMPEPVRSLLLSLSVAGSGQVLREQRDTLNQTIKTAIGDFCAKAISGRYPFVKSSSLDVTQDDFARLFAPAGLIDDFFQKSLTPYVDTSTRPWSFKQVGDVRMSDASGSLVQFQRAQLIRDVFFRGGGRAAGMRLEFKPLEMDASITQFILDVDGQLVTYSHGPQVPAPIQWPGPRGSTQVRLQISPPGPGGVSGQVFEGPWALFRMLDRAQIDSTSQPEKFLVVFNVDGRKAQFEVVTTSVQNPFRMRDLEQFQCPGRL